MAIKIKQDLIEKTLCSLREEQLALLHTGMEQINLEQVRSLVQAIAQSRDNTFFFTGVGKSGIIADKCAKTFTSCGLRSMVLCPVNALHGDIAAIRRGDVVFLLSRSGQTQELLSLVPFLKARGARLVALVCSREARLCELSDWELVLDLAKEPGSLEMIPTLSSTLQLMMGDLLALTLVRVLGLTREQFAKNHPAGRIGKRLTLKVTDLMISGVQLPLCEQEQTVGETLTELSVKGAGCLLITDLHNHLLGIFTDGDLRRALQRHGGEVLHKKLEDVMTTTPRTIEADLLAFSALEEMESDPLRPITALPVIERGILKGLIRMHDLLQAGL